MERMGGSAPQTPAPAELPVNSSERRLETHIQSQQKQSTEASESKLHEAGRKSKVCDRVWACALFTVLIALLTHKQIRGMVTNEAMQAKLTT